MNLFEKSFEFFTFQNLKYELILSSRTILHLRLNVRCKIGNQLRGKECLLLQKKKKLN